MSKPSNTTRPVCLTDGAILFYPQGCGVVRSISLIDLASNDSDADCLAASTVDVGLAGMAQESGTITIDKSAGYVTPRNLEPVNDAEPPAAWTNPKNPLGFPEDFADLLGAWLDWCDEQEAAVEEARQTTAAQTPMRIPDGEAYVTYPTHESTR